MTINVPPHYDDFHAAVILNGDKNALWERREAATWHGVKNLWLGWHLAVFLTTAADPSLALVLLSKSSKSLDHMLRKGYTAYSEWHLTAFLTTGTDPSHSFRMTINISLIMTPCPPIVILNGDKNALWERREAATWHGVKNLLPRWRLSWILPDTFVLLPSNLCM